ncbi:alpha/beta hydrolase fold domain-containing protein [Geodermatophilus sabuli]|uniref:Acetyl esterase/lipase n=1 Tax=Geodermatophilus sabuli TaxID=1564158 RepID=A0A285EJK4_9ACTN|nr:alpha/beta hydrolase fold domain-containing protein [Geodermatophilus sabuli]MBB3083785.1 acetyl esterase/lipase [Geodermatophilus sabuli]SNX99298.1 Acetyl esterase/lipase [Geodermatophilus sabuli]
MPEPADLLDVARPEPGPLSDGTAAFPFAPPVRGGDGELRWEALVYAVEPGYRPLMLDLWVPEERPAEGAPVVVWVHGGGWVHGSRRRRAPHLHQNRVVERIVAAGFAVALVDYRLAAEAPFPAGVLDVQAAVRWLRAQADVFGLDGSRVALWGESAGAHLSLLAGLCRRLEAEPPVGEATDVSAEVQAVVDWYGPSDFAAMSSPVDAESEELGEGDPFAILLRDTTWSRDELSPVRYVRPDGPAVFVAHGEDDQLVPVEQSRLLAEALVEARVDTEYLETAGDHVFVGATVVPEVTDRSIAFLCRVLAGRRLGDPRPLDPHTADLEERMAATGMWPLLDAPAPVARERGVVMRRDFYPPRPFPVASVTDGVLPGPAGDVRIRVQRPEQPTDVTVLYVHGGGWVIGDLASHQGSAARLAATAGAVVVQVDYRLAPEDPYPAGLDDCRAAAAWVLEHIDEFGGDPARLVIAGDSAGGNLAAVLTQELVDRGTPVAALFLIYPGTDLRGEASADVRLQYLGPDADGLAGDPRVSPVLAPTLAALPPTVIGIGAHDFLYADTVEYAAALRAAGVAVVLREFPTLNHGFFSYGSVSPAAEAAADLMCRDLHRLLHRATA